MKGDAESGVEGDVHLRLTYRNGGKSTGGGMQPDLTVQKPTRPSSTRQIGGCLIETNPNNPAEQHCYVQITYTALSRFNYVFRNMLWDETVFALDDDPGLLPPPIQGDGHTDNNGQVLDQVGWWTSWATFGHTPTMLFHYGQTIKLGGWNGDNFFWANRLGGWDNPNVVVNPSPND